MYGKCYESMYEGSMVGAGLNVFAVWNYAVVKSRAGRVEINPKLLAFTLGGSEDDITAALDFLQRPDPISRSKEAEGRRIIKEGQFQYRLVNWEYYQRMRNKDDQREYNRQKQAEYRARAKLQPGQSLRSHINQQVAADPVTKTDQSTKRKKSRETRAVKEYDQDHETPETEGVHAESNQAAG